MGWWRYRLKTSDALLKAVNSGRPHDILKMLKASYRELRRNKIISAEDYELFIEDYDSYDALDDDDVLEDIVNSEWEEFYTMCYNAGILIDQLWEE